MMRSAAHLIGRTLVPSMIVTAAAAAEPLGAPATINFNLVLTEANFQTGCFDAQWIDESACADLSSPPVDGPAFLWLVVSSSDGFDSFPQGVNTAQFGIEYDVAIGDWNLCTNGLEIPTPGWPASGTGNSVSWGVCHEPAGSSARIGYFELDDGDQGSFAITPNPNTGDILITDCLHRSAYACPGNAGSADLALGVTPECDQHDLVLDAPENVAATDVGCDVAVSWTHDGADVTYFDVRRNGELLTSLDADARDYLDDAIPDNGGTFDYTVTARAACGGSTASSPASATVESTPAPTSCVASDDLCGRVEITWTDDSTNEVGFQVLWNGAVLATTPADVTTYTDSINASVAGNDYSVRAIGPCGPTAPTASDVGVGLAPPSAPTDLSASNGLCDVVSLAWTDGSTIDTEIRVLRDGALAATLPADATSWDDLGATPGVEHTYALIASNVCGDGDPSDTAAGIAVDDVPAAPTDLAATDGNCGAVTVTWTEAGDYETGVEVYRDDVLVHTADAGVQLFQDETATPDLPHTYAVVALNDCGASASSASDEGYLVTEADPIPAISLVDPAPATECAENPITFTWNAEPGVVQYDFLIAATCGGPELVRDFVTDTTITVSMPPGLDREWRVRGLNVCNEWGEWSACRAVSAEPTLEVENVDAAFSSGQYSFFWSAAIGAEHYMLYLTPSFDFEDCYELTPETLAFTVTGTDTLLVLPGQPRFNQAWVRAFGCGMLGPPSDCVGIYGEIPVVLDYFRARPGPSVVTTEWRTLAEEGIAAFHLDRARGEGPVERLTDSPIPAGAGRYTHDDATVEPGATYTYTLVEVDDHGDEATLGRLEVTAAPRHDALTLEARPNPFNPRVTLTFDVPEAARVRLRILDPAGRILRTLRDATIAGGRHAAVWDGTDAAGHAVASGVYFARIDAAGERRTQRLVLLK